ncbi:MAG: phosphoribosylamine--glycine ligase [Rhodobacteraceae bacterium]|jgi:phosphoribosylamine--glycine ligase|nr:phosphoribosylamine--glycine ligase [Paracoccaceae bacterium]MBT6867460.1 phosphoribosylamine--glycine ligase [Candidatus Neomarinimicrobiota bacterium]MBT7172510.1 phosphoribosylamine--glycine ligase [Candidatus Neomarinimicrobiota bacterium]
MSNILLVGSGAREVAIAKQIKKSSSPLSLFCVAPTTNPQIKTLTTSYFEQPLNENGVVVEIAKKLSIDLAIIGPEGPLEAGLVDALEKEGVLCVGPRKNVARIETSKAFARNIIDLCDGEKNPERMEFSSLDGVKDFLKNLNEQYVIKYDGLMGGKGVKISGEHLHSIEESLSYAKSIVDGGGTFLIEEKFIGEEFSLMSFCDGTYCAHMPAVQDHKRAFEGDVGPNTGGMGTYSFADHSLPFLSKEDIMAAQKTNERVATELYKKTGEKFRGILYGGFMLTGDGVKVIEYNARFGDPEAMNVLSLLETDFMDICNAIVAGSLADLKIVFANKATVCKYVVPVGYPNNPSKDFEVICNTKLDGLYLAAVQEKDGIIVATGSRTAAFVGVDPNIVIAEQIAEKGATDIGGNLFHRKDIGTKDLIGRRKKHMKKVLG